MNEQQAERLIQSIDKLTFIIGLGIATSLTIAPATWSNSKELQAEATEVFTEITRKIEDTLKSI